MSNNFTKTLTFCRALYDDDFNAAMEEIKNELNSLGEADISILEEDFATLKELVQMGVDADELAAIIASILERINAIREHEALVKLLRNKKTKKSRNGVLYTTMLAFFVAFSAEVSKFISDYIYKTSKKLAQDLSLAMNDENLSL